MPRGYSASSDVLTTADGRPIGDLFAEVQAATDLANEQSARFVDLFTTRTTTAVTSVLQSLSTGPGVFEPASEFGVPVGHRELFATLDMGATFQWMDAAWKSSWRYLADATADEITAQANAVIAADAELVFREVMRAVFRPTNRQITDPRTNAVIPVYAFANGDNWVPPSYEGNTFDGAHTHYRTTGAASLVSADVDEMLSDLRSHGYSAENGTQLVVWANPLQMNVIKGWTVAGGNAADFIPAMGSAFFAPGELIGAQPPASFAGFPVTGAYDGALLIESSRIPAGYVLALASGGRLAPQNPVLFREHPKFPGLQIIEGPRTDYPLIDSYYVHGFGTGIRHRLAGMVMQVTTAASYTAPSIYA